ncbi:MAG: DHH family phosphoesterase [Erysipelotrichaceae bacterium]|nr:DHH family phosphoesterase [Erysipelotrichaceae bacterium]
MLSRTDKVRIIAAVTVFLELVAVIILKLILKLNIELLAYVFFAVGTAWITYLFIYFAQERKRNEIGINRVLGTEAKNAMNYGEVGIIIYDSENIVTWLSDFLQQRGFALTGEKLTKAIDGLGPLFKENAPKVTLQADDRVYEFVRSVNEPAVFVKDVTDLYNARDTYNREKVVLGLVHFDNYNETVQKEDEQKIADINTQIRQKVVNWVSEYHGVIRRIRAERFLVIINEGNFRQMLSSGFAILDEVKKAAEHLRVDITTSMSFASGYSSIDDEDAQVNELMELVLARGGDQVAYRCYGKEVEFFGTSSQASEKTSKVRARVMAKGFGGVIEESSNVFIVPHSEADLDALGACLGFDTIVHNYGKKSFIIFDGIKIEPKTLAIYDDNILKLVVNHVFISEADALSLMDADSLVVAVDHHSLDLTSAPKLMEKSERTVIIDHHRRKNDNTISAMMIYNEPSASSSVELVSEMIQYQAVDTEIDPTDATIMYGGLLVDTDFLKARCTARSFEVCAWLKREGADTAAANEWLQDSLSDFVSKAAIAKYMEVIDGRFAIAAVDPAEGRFNRTTLAQSANYMISIRDIEASFVISETEDNLCAISARSNGKINVQVILEKLGGGGHYNAAGLQKSGTTVAQLKKELLAAIADYQQKEGSENESDTLN